MIRYCFARKLFLGIAVLLVLMTAGCGDRKSYGGQQNEANTKIETPIRIDVNAGADQQVIAEDVVSLSGSALAQGSTVVGYSWRQISGPTAEFLSSTTHENISFKAPIVQATETLIFELVATSVSAASASDTVAIFVHPGDNTEPTTKPEINFVVNAGVDQTVLEQTPFVLSGSAAISQGQVASYKWAQKSGVEASNTMPMNSAATALIAPEVTQDELLEFELTVESDGGQSVVDSVIVSVKAVADPIPEQPVLVVNGGVDQTVDERTLIVLSGAAAVSSGSIVGYQWTQIDGPAAVNLLSDTQSATTYQAPEVDENTELVFQIEASTNEGATLSDTVKVTVKPTNEAPYVSAGENKVVAELSDVTLKGDVTDEGIVADYYWQQISGTDVSFNDNGDYSMSFRAPSVTEPQTLLFVLTASDDSGASSSDTVKVQLNPLPKIEITGAVEKGPFEVGSNIQFERLFESGSKTGKTVASLTNDNLGRFVAKVPGAGFYWVTASGRYRNEINGTLSARTVQLESLVWVSESGSDQVFVNVLTHIVSKRVLFLVESESLSFEQALARAYEELAVALNNVVGPYQGADLSQQSIFYQSGQPEGSYLLTLSTLLYQYVISNSNFRDPTSLLTDLLMDLQQDFAADGLLDSSDLVLAGLKSIMGDIDAEKVFTTLSLLSNGIDGVQISDINQYLDTDADGLANAIDNDDDNDGIPDNTDEDPITPNLLVSDRSISVDEDGSVLLNITTNSPTDEATVFVLNVAPRAGALSGVYPEITYQPNADYNGTDSFSYMLKQGDLTSKIATVSVEVLPIQDPPIISGTPSTTVTEGSQYRFFPSADDLDNDELRFVVENKPSWLVLDEQTGALTGTPSFDDVTEYKSIKVGVDDGTITTFLPEFSIQVTYATVQPPSGLVSTVSADENGDFLVQFDWNPIANATYQIEISDNRNFFGENILTGSDAETLEFPLAQGVYYWRVRSLNAADTPSRWGPSASVSLGMYQKKFGGSANESGRLVLATSDGGAILISSTPSFGDTSGDDWFIKLDAQGEQQWEYILRHAGGSRVTDATITDDGALVAVGSTGFSDQKGYIVKIDTAVDAAERLLWEQEFRVDGAERERFSAVQVSGGIVYVAGAEINCITQDNSTRCTSAPYKLYKFADNGMGLLESVDMPVPPDAVLDGIGSLRFSDAGDILVSCSVRPQNSTDDFFMDGAACIMNITSNGDLNWSWTSLNTFSFLNGRFARELPNGQFVLAGQSFGGGDNPIAFFSSAGRHLGTYTAEGGYSNQREVIAVDAQGRLLRLMSGRQSDVPELWATNGQGQTTVIKRFTELRRDASYPVNITEAVGGGLLLMFSERINSNSDIVIMRTDELGDWAAD